MTGTSSYVLETVPSFRLYFNPSPILSSFFVALWRILLNFHLDFLCYIGYYVSVEELDLPRVRGGKLLLWIEILTLAITSLLSKKDTFAVSFLIVYVFGLPFFQRFCVCFVF